MKINQEEYKQKILFSPLGRSDPDAATMMVVLFTFCGIKSRKKLTYI